MRAPAWAMLIGACGRTAGPPPVAAASSTSGAAITPVRCGPTLPIAPSRALAEDIVTSGVGRHADELRACVMRWATEDACTDHVRVELAFAVVADGSVANVEVSGGPTALEACLCDRVATMRFRAVEGRAEVHYPLLFARPRELPAGDAACDERR